MGLRQKSWSASGAVQKTWGDSCSGPLTNRGVVVVAREGIVDGFVYCL